MENLKYEFMENLADKVHQVWSSWMRWMFCSGGNAHDTKWGTAWYMNPDRYKRWQRQLSTDFADLSESEQQFDRNVIQEHCKDLRNIEFVGEFNHDSSLWTKLQQQLGCTLQRGKYKIVLIRDDE